MERLKENDRIDCEDSSPDVLIGDGSEEEDDFCDDSSVIGVIFDDDDDDEWFAPDGGLTAEAQDFLSELDANGEFV